METRMGANGRCPRCATPFTAGARYCASCGEPVDPALVAELQRLYVVLGELDKQVAIGRGGQSVELLRDEVRASYLAQRADPGRTAAATPGAVTRVAPKTPAATTQPVMPAAAAATSEPVRHAPTVTPTPARPTAPAAPPQPAFAWRAFVADQAIAIMAYLGGFLLLIATLSFEVGGWQALPDGVKLGLVVVTYVAFAVLGFAFRRSARMRTVGGAYLGVFALMTPLVALAAYRFELAGRGFSIAGMICASAVYACIIYLSLAARTRFATYAYLGWTSLLIAALALIPAFTVSPDWGATFVGICALVLLAPSALVAPRRPSARLLADSAVQLGALVGPLAALWTIVLAAVTWSGPLDRVMAHAGALAIGALVTVAVALGWSAATRVRDGIAVQPYVRDALDWLTLAAVPFAAVCVSTWLQADEATRAWLFTVLALGMSGVAWALRRNEPARQALRIAVHVLALALALLGAAIANNGSIPDWALVGALFVAAAVLVHAAVGESAPWWLFGAGILGSVGFYHLVVGFYPPKVLSSSYGYAVLGDVAQLTPAFYGLTVAFWLLALALGFRGRLERTVIQVPVLATRTMPGAPTTISLPPSDASNAGQAQWGAPRQSDGIVRWIRSGARRYAPPLYAVALADAIYFAIVRLPRGFPWGMREALVLLALAALALVAGMRERWPVWAGIVVAAFGCFGATIGVFNAPGVYTGMLLIVVLWLVGLAVRRVLGGFYAPGPYVVATWASVAGGFALMFGSAGREHSIISGLLLSAVGLLLIAVLATAAALGERQWGWTVVPAVFALWALLVGADTGATVVLSFAFVAVGAGLRAWRGLNWNLAWYVAALVGSLVAFGRVSTTAAVPDAGPPVVLALAWLVIAYAAAAQDRRPLLTVAVPFYAFIALSLMTGGWAVPGPVALTFAAALLGAVLSRWAGWPWALALYITAIGASYVAATNVSHLTTFPVEALLLCFAALAYVVALLEESPYVGFVVLIYAALAVFAQHDEHVALPIALGLTAAGLLIERARGLRWAWPAYGGALLAAGWTTVLAAPDARFMTLAMASLALMAYAVAAAQSRPEVLVGAFALAAFAVSAAVDALGWGATSNGAAAHALAFLALGWAIYAAEISWSAIPWLTPTSPVWWTGPGFERAANSLEYTPQRRSGQHMALPTADTRAAGALLHRATGLLLVGIALLVSLAAPDVLGIHALATQATALALLSLAGMLALWPFGSAARQRGLRYAAGFIVAIALSTELRWAFADNPQWYVLAPGAYLLVIGALLPVDTALGTPAQAARWASLTGALLLLLPSLAQSFAPTSDNWLYALLLAAEALVIAGAGVGTRSRPLVVVGSSFVGLAAIRGGALAIDSGVPVALVIALFALLLMGLATWLSLRLRHDGDAPPPPTPAPVAPRTPRETGAGDGR